MTILQLTNAYGPRTGGIRTHLDSVRPRYAARGITAALLVPGERDRVDADAHGPVITLRAPVLPINRDYRNLWNLRRVRQVVADLRPDAIEILDKWTLPRLARRLAADGYPTLGFSCERLDQVLTPYLGRGPAVTAAIVRYNDWFARQFATVVCHSRYAAAELRAAGAANVQVIPLGVDLDQYRPAARDEALRAELLAGAEVLLLYAGRLVREKSVGLLGAVMARLGPRYRLVVAGAGPAAAALAAAPHTTLLGFVDRARLAALYASCDRFVFPSAIETFALSVLEALACGCPVVAVAGGAVAEVLRPPAGVLARAHPAALAAAVVAACATPRAAAGAAARELAARYPWAAAVDGLLTLHQAAGAARGATAR